MNHKWGGTKPSPKPGEKPGSGPAARPLTGAEVLVAVGGRRRGEGKICNCETPVSFSLAVTDRRQTGFPCRRLSPRAGNHGANLSIKNRNI